MMTTDDEDE